MENITIKTIKELPIPEKQKLGAKESKIPELLKTIQRGCRAQITNTFIPFEGTNPKTGLHHKKWITKDTPKIATIASFLNKQHKKGQQKQFQFEQRSHSTPTSRTVTLYITHEGKT